MKTIGERVRDLRKARGFGRQGDLAKLVGVDQSVISDIENGAGFKADVLMRLCEHLGTTAEYLMLGEESSAAGETELLGIYRKTSESGREAMLAMAKGLKDRFPRHPMNMGNMDNSRGKPVAEEVQQDTVDNEIDFPLPQTSMRKRATRAKDHPPTESRSSQGGKHTASPSKTSRSRGN